MRCEHWAPFWRYLDLGRYGRQLTHLFEHVDPARVRVIRYRELVDHPRTTLDQVCHFLGVDTGVLTHVPPANVGGWVADGAINTMLSRTIRVGAAAGAYVPPAAWRAARRPLLAALRRGDPVRPPLAAGVRARLVEEFTEDNVRLSGLLGGDYSDWLSASHRELSPAHQG